MKVGDLVKFVDQIQGWESARGIVVSFNGSEKYPIVAWFSVERPIQTEIADFLEIMNKS